MDFTPTNAVNQSGRLTDIEQSATKCALPDNSTIRTHHATIYLYRIFRVCGIDMPPNHRLSYIMYSFVLNGLVNVCYPLSFVISYVRPTAEVLVLGDLLSSLQACIGVFSSVSKFLTMAYMMPRLRTSDAILERLERRCREPAELKALATLVRLCRRIIIAYFFVYLSFMYSACIGAFMRGRPPYGTYLPLLDWRRSKTELVASTLIEIVLLHFTCLIQVADDAYALLFVNILRTHMKILRVRVSKLGCNESESLPEHFEELKLCIEDHKDFLALYGIAVPIISTTVFIQFLVTAILISITLINIVLFTSDINALVAAMLYLIVVIMEILPICYYAQCLIDECAQLSVAIFHANWIGQEARFRKILIVFMQSSQRTLGLTAGKLVPINLASFIRVVKFSFSLYTLIENMGLSEKLRRK